MLSKLYYKRSPGKYKYVLQGNNTLILDDKFALGCNIETPYILLNKSGLLVIKKGYAWDGLTLFPDFPKALRASLVHDALIQLCDEGHLGNGFRQSAHKEMYDYIQIDGGSNTLALTVYLGLTLFHPFYWRVKKLCRMFKN